MLNNDHITHKISGLAFKPQSSCTGADKPLPIPIHCSQTLDAELLYHYIHIVSSFYSCSSLT